MDLGAPRGRLRSGLHRRGRNAPATLCIIPAMARRSRWAGLLRRAASVNVEVRANRLRGQCGQYELTQRELAKELGVSTNYIPALEGGARHPGPRLRQRMMMFFKCAFEEIFRRGAG